MRSSTIKWIAGTVVFFLPTITAIVATSILRRSFGEAFLVSMILAAIVPPALVLSSSAKWRIVFAFGLWVLLLVQFLLILLAGFRD